MIIYRNYRTNKDPWTTEIPLLFSRTPDLFWVPLYLVINIYRSHSDGIELELKYVTPPVAPRTPPKKEPFLTAEFPLDYSSLPKDIDWSPETLEVEFYERPKSIAYTVRYRGVVSEKIVKKVTITNIFPNWWQ